MARRFVVLGDMVESRQRPDRDQLVGQVRDGLARLGADFERFLQAQPVITRGLDEFSAVFADPSGAFDFLVRLNLSMWPARFRMAAVLGEVDIEADSTDAAVMDGPAFHRAAARIGALKADGRTFAVEGDAIDPAAAALATALGSAHQSMTASLKGRTIETLRQLHGRPPGEAPPTQEEIAKAMQLTSRQAISDALRRADSGTLQQMEDALRQWLAELVPGARS